MSLLMQALKKAEHAKQKQSSSPATEVAADKNAARIQNDEIALSPKDLDKTASDEVNLDMLDLELSPLAATHTHPIEAEPVSTEQALIAEGQPRPHHFEESESAQPGAAPSNNPPNRSTENTRLENENRSNAETLSQQLSAKTRLEQQKAAALASGKILAEQQKAKTVFTSKQPTPNRRALLIGVLGLTAVMLFIGAGYTYLQITPQSSSLLLNTLPIQTSSVPAPAIAVAAATPTDDAPAASMPSTPVAMAAPHREQQEAADTSQRAPHIASSKANAVPAIRRPKTTFTGESESIQVRQTTIDSQINPSLNNAYQFFITGDLGSAQQQYRTVLRQEPNNRDALLGMAAIALSRKQNAQAGSFYTRLLELDPADPDAIAGLTSLQGGDPSQNESRLKKILAQDPQAGAILFALGNLYAQQSRWPDAQQSYFRAYGTAPGNADYAFNLAVSLDRLNQEKLALDFYQRALSLAQSRPGNFNKASVQDRIKELQLVEGSK